MYYGCPHGTTEWFLGGGKAGQTHYPAMELIGGQSYLDPELGRQWMRLIIISGVRTKEHQSFAAVSAGPKISCLFPVHVQFRRPRFSE